VGGTDIKMSAPSQQADRSCSRSRQTSGSGVKRLPRTRTLASPATEAETFGRERVRGRETRAQRVCVIPKELATEESTSDKSAALSKPADPSGRYRSPQDDTQTLPLPSG
jgi:hypothetical protein